MRASEVNPGAVAFWKDVIAEFTDGTATESERDGQRHAWRVFSFESIALRATS